MACNLACSPLHGEPRIFKLTVSAVLLPALRRGIPEFNFIYAACCTPPLQSGTYEALAGHVSHQIHIPEVFTMSVRHGFELVRQQSITELHTEAQLFRHLRTGAEVLSLTNDDPNKVFCITFRTPPSDSTGVAHILEHSVLCGSRKYPVKEPFVELLKGSLQTFLNACTYPDKTCYPVASQNLRDFYNLIDVYLDAVFYPRLTPLIFQQEGWHYEIDDLQSELAYKGVVFNEMKGAYSSPESLLAQYSQESVFPDSVYALDSGGDPKKIPELTHERFAAFHRRYYHPSNSRIYFYGDDNPDDRLLFLNQYLENFDRLDIDSSLALQPRLEHARQITRTFPSGDNAESSRKGMSTVNWLLTEATDAEGALAFSVLEYILLGMPASPLRKALLDSGLGDGIAGVGVEGELLQMYFSTGLKGVAAEQLDRVEPFILDTLSDICRMGIDPRTVEAALNTIEFRLRENNSGRVPRGLILVLRALTAWLYGGDPFSMIAFEAPLNQVKEKLRTNPLFFEALMDKFFLQNRHRATVLLRPDPELAARNSRAEQDHLSHIRASLKADQVQALIDDTQTLKKAQQTPDPPEALATIPRLALADIDKTNQITPIVRSELDNGTILYHDLFTSGIFYSDIGFNLHLLPQSYLPYVPLFGRALLETGTAREDFVSLSQRIGQKTGGIKASWFTSGVRDMNQGTAWLFLRGKAMTGQSSELLNIFADILCTAQLDNQKRFKQILLEEKASQEQKLIPHGHQMVSSRLRAHFNEAEWADEQMNGISYLFFLRELEHKIDTAWNDINAVLEDMRRILIRRSAMIMNSTLDEKSWSNIEPRARALLNSLPDSPARPVPWAPAPFPAREGLIVPSQVNYVGKGANLYELGYRYRGSIQVITGLLRTSWLWEQVRVQGGAYGAFCSFDRMTGGFVFVSYRDPNLLKTLAVFDQTAAFLRERPLDYDELSKSIIGAIGDIDAPLLPDARGYVSMQRYLNGNTDEVRQQMRDEILGTSPEEVRAFADVLTEVEKKGIIKVLGSEPAIQEANRAANDSFRTCTVL